MEKSKPTVLITGITGYLGSHVCKVFLEDERYNIKGTVRDKSKKEKIDPIKAAFGENFEQLELVEADLMDPISLDWAIEGSEIVIHTASPNPSGNPKKESDVIDPAVNGTQAILDVCAKHWVKRLVITSSFLTIFDPAKNIEVFDETDWLDPGKKTAVYNKSKVMAEKLAWDFQSKLPAAERFEIVTLHPSLIFGPVLIKTPFTSEEIIYKLMMGKFPGIPKINVALVDVRDVAIAHLRALDC